MARVSSDTIYPHTRYDLIHTLFNIKSLLSTQTIKRYDDNILNKLLESQEFVTVDIDDIICCQMWLYVPEFKNIFGVNTSISGYKCIGSNKVILHEGHHRVAKLITEGTKTVQIKVYELPQYLSDMLIEQL